MHVRRSWLRRTPLVFCSAIDRAKNPVAVASSPFAGVKKKKRIRGPLLSDRRPAAVPPGHVENDRTEVHLVPFSYGTFLSRASVRPSSFFGIRYTATCNVM
jgi:hypothetical protein